MQNLKYVLFCPLLFNLCPFISNIICESYLNLTAASSHYKDNWICDETWFRLLNTHYPHLKYTFNFTREGLNRALSASAKAGQFTGPNERLNARTLVIRGE